MCIRDRPYDIEDIIVSEYGTTVVGLEMMRAVHEENAEEDLSLIHIQMCIRDSHGRQFVTDYIADYFNSKSCYQGTIDPDTFDAEQNSIFNEYELANISKIAEWEEQKASQGN